MAEEHAVRLLDTNTANQIASTDTPPIVGIR